MNNTQVDDPHDIDVVMVMYNSIEYSNVYSKISVSLWQYNRDETALDNNSNIIDFHTNGNNSISFKVKQQIAGKTGNVSTKDVEILVLLNYFSNI